MNKIRISVIYPADILGRKVGGIETFIRGFIIYSPDDFHIRCVGITTDPDRIIRKETEECLGAKKFSFLPVYFEEDENRKGLVPLSLRFLISLLLHSPDVRGEVLVFNRPEPVVAFLGKKSPKIGLIHNDVRKQLARKYSEVFWARMPKLYFLFISFIFKFLDKIFVVNGNSLDNFKRKYASMRKKFAFLPTWYDPEIFSPFSWDKSALKKDLTQAKAISFTDKWILFVGRFQKQKEPAKVVSSFYEYHKKDPKTSLIMIGEGNLRPQVKEYIRKLGISRKVLIVDTLNQIDLADYYRASDLLVLASNFEGMPRCVLEALGSGIPVVTTPVGEVSLIVKNGFSGEVTPDFTPESLAKAMSKILANPAHYCVENCTSSVAGYTPEKVLQPFFWEIYRLFRDKGKAG